MSFQAVYTPFKEVGCKNIIVTLGSEGAVLLQDKMDPLLIPTSKVQKKWVAKHLVNNEFYWKEKMACSSWDVFIQ